jgi:hypothetical protein
LLLLTSLVPALPSSNLCKGSNSLLHVFFLGGVLRAFKARVAVAPGRLLIDISAETARGRLGIVIGVEGHKSIGFGVNRRQQLRRSQPHSCGTLLDIARGLSRREGWSLYLIQI